MTAYDHISAIRVGEGDFVQEGEPLARISAVPENPTLHFELWAVIDRGNGVPGDTDMAPVDPTRALYAWEQRHGVARLRASLRGHRRGMAQRHDPHARTDDQRRLLTEEMRRLERDDDRSSPGEPDGDPGGRETGEPSEEELREVRRRLEDRDDA